MTAQDIDVLEFTKDDITRLRGLIASSGYGPSTVKVYRILFFPIKSNCFNY